MTERTLTGEVLHVVAPAEQGDYDLTPDLSDRAAGRHVLVVREGGRPSWPERIVSFLRRRPIEAITLVADAPGVSEGDVVTATVRETTEPGLYEAVELAVS